MSGRGTDTSSTRMLRMFRRLTSISRAPRDASEAAMARAVGTLFRFGRLASEKPREETLSLRTVWTPIPGL